MSFPKKTNLNFHLGGSRVYEVANGLDEFLKVLERDFFAEAKVQCNFDAETKKTDLVLGIHLNFGITESLHYLNKGSWGGMTFTEHNTLASSSFKDALLRLNQQNSYSIDIAEISFHFRDTSVIVSRLYDQSIPQQLGDILLMISEHFVYLTKGLTEMPYEIFVPVFEDKAQKAGEPLQKLNDYFDFWGLYFEDEKQHQVMVYSLEERKLNQDDLFLLE
ncbi:hypothetical protein [Flagellimonas sp.]|uniref:hypothetical protein n=1 Tax=Flagellimonas sp. TaxID=2058762 RepID=UPI003BAAF758